jgi:hypothetical protein
MISVTAWAPNDGPCETETCHAILVGHEIGLVKPGNSRKIVMKIVFVHIYQETFQFLLQSYSR